MVPNLSCVLQKNSAAFKRLDTWDPSTIVFELVNLERGHFGHFVQHFCRWCWSATRARTTSENFNKFIRRKFWRPLVQTSTKSTFSFNIYDNLIRLQIHTFFGASSGFLNAVYCLVREKISIHELTRLSLYLFAWETWRHERNLPRKEHRAGLSMLEEHFHRKVKAILDRGSFSSKCNKFTHLPANHPIIHLLIFRTKQLNGYPF